MNEGDARVTLLVWTDLADGNYGLDGAGPNAEDATGTYRFTMGWESTLGCNRIARRNLNCPMPSERLRGYADSS
jgi:hypothetical protein